MNLFDEIQIIADTFGADFCGVADLTLAHEEIARPLPLRLPAWPARVRIMPPETCRASATMLCNRQAWSESLDRNIHQRVEVIAYWSNTVSKGGEQRMATKAETTKTTEAAPKKQCGCGCGSKKEKK
jgi:hypothetical protein